MKQKLIYKLLELLSSVTGKFFLYITKNHHNEQGKTAVQDSSGVWHVGNVFSKDDITYGITQNGIVEPAETKLVHLLLSLLKKQKSELSVFDIGANIGYYGLISATLFKAKVNSFEPIKEYAECIEKASLLNGVSEDLTVHNIALSNKPGNATLNQSGSGSSLEKDFNDNADLPTINVHVEVLDTLVTKKVIPAPDFIKIDVEGHEWAVLQGAEQTVTIYKPIIFIELCTTLKEIGRNYTNPHYLETLNFFFSHGYNIFLLADDHTLESWSSEKKVARAGMFLCLHKEHHKDFLTNITASYTIKG